MGGVVTNVENGIKRFLYIHRAYPTKQGVQKINDIKNLFQLGFVRFFLLKQKNLNDFRTGCPKSALRGGKVSATKRWVKSRICRYGLTEDFLGKYHRALIFGPP